MSEPAVETEFGFSYEYGLDIYDYATEAWLPFRLPTGINPQVTPVTTEAMTYDDFGSPNEVKLSESWTLDLTVQARRYEDGRYLEEVELLKKLTLPTATGNAAVGRFRWYDKPYSGTPNPTDAFEGHATVTENRSNTDNQGVAGWSITLTGKGRRTQIENPFEGWDDETGLPIYKDANSGN